MLSAKLCTQLFQKLIKTVPQQVTHPENQHEYLIYKLGDYELFVEIGPDFRVDYQVRMVVTHDPHKVGES